MARGGGRAKRSSIISHMPEPEEDPLLPPPIVKQKPIGHIQIVITILTPWLSYLFLLTTWGFTLHDYSARTVWFLGSLFAVACISCWVSAYKKVRFRPQTARWPFIMAILLTGGTFFGITNGDYLYWTHMWQFYQFHKMNPYVNVDPSKAKGESIMDAGQVYFKEGSFVATEEAIAYEMKDIYCAAPIVRQPLTNNDMQTGGSPVATPYSGTIDFWAVGVNCCMPSGERFRCFDTGNSLARSGLRLLRDDLRPFFKLAVEEWSSQYNMPVKHPLFFYWMNDPLAEINSNALSGTWIYYTCAMTYFCINAIGTALLYFWMRKIGM